MNTKVSNYRRFIGYTQMQMANSLGISVQAYRNKEKGITPFKDSEKIIIKDKLQNKGFSEVTIDDIFFVK